MTSAASQRPELNHDTTVWTQYYHCVIGGIPLEMAPPQLAEHLMVQEGSEAAKALGALGRCIVLHSIYTYKEALDAKFGYLGFFLRCAVDAPMDEATKAMADELARRWIEKELSAQLLLGRMRVTLAQPAACYHAAPFLKAFRSRCSIASKDVSPDPMKTETFLWTHVTFFADEGDAGSALNPTWARQGESFESAPNRPEEQPGREWRPVGTFSVSSLTPRELLWMKKGCKAFPPISITNGDLSTAHVEHDALVQYFTKHLSPFIAVTK